ncbi:MAG: hypothetical protein PHW08_15110, partial [Kiritimatiellae bacterium]|nr:hypothetical protein [Kiritimatiellia bacterium]
MGADTSTADKALQAWLQDETLVKSLHVEIGLDASKSFVHFKPTYLPVPKMVSFPAVKKAFEKDLSVVFQAHGRGTFCEIEQHIRNHEYVFVMHHGDPYRRDTELKLQTAIKPLYFWPGDPAISAAILRRGPPLAAPRPADQRSGRQGCLRRCRRAGWGGGPRGALAGR